MSALAPWFTPEVTRTAAMTILHFLWQGAALAALASAAMALLRTSAARYAVAMVALALMVAAPVCTFIALQQRLQVENPAAQAIFVDTSSATAVMVRISQPATPSRSSNPASPDYLLFLVEAWLAGVFLLSLRPAAGFVALERLRRKQAHPVEDLLLARCLSLQNRLGLTRIIRYCEWLHLEAPAVAGWFRPVVFLPLAAITGLSTDQLDAVIAHELAHVKRLDAFVNLFQIAAETLLFYHPAVWWLSNRIRAERENCCDDVAIAVCGNAATYASALATMAEWQAAPALAMAANRHPLAARVSRILGVDKLRDGVRKNRVRSASLAASVLCLSTSLLAGHALFGASHPTARQTPPAVAAAPSATSVATAAAAPTPADVPVVVSAIAPASAPAPTPVVDEVVVTAPALAPMPTAGVPAAPEITVTASLAEASVQDSAAQEKASAPSTPKSSYIDGMKAAGLDNLTVDQLIALKIQGITPEYVREIAALGTKADADEIVAIKIQGLTPEYVKAIRDSGLKADADELIAMKIQGVTPEYIKSLRDFGFKADADEAIAMKIQNVTPAYVKSLRDLGLQAHADEAVAMKIQGITPEYVRELQALKLKLDDETLIAMKVQGVTPEYVKAMQATGLQFDAEELVGAEVQGVTPEFIESARRHGFKNLDLDKLVQLKNSGVLDQ
jgi:beta-lactamase regulating signal transducer with metallopeptidase domain